MIKMRFECNKEDKIDIIASDQHLIQKLKENSYFNCPSGGPVVQHTILSLLDESPKHGVSIEKIVEKISHNPSKVFNINRRGFIKEGYFADIVLIDPNSPTLVTKKSLLYKCGWSPFEGVTFSSSIHSTILNGRVVYSNGKVNETPHGKKLVFDR